MIPQIEHRQIDADRRMHHLIGLAFIDGKGRAQAFVAVDDCLQRLLQCVYVECAVEAQHKRHVVGSRCAQLFEEPKPLLGKGQGQWLAAVGWRDLNRSGGSH